MQTPSQLAQGTALRTASTDSGVVIAATSPGLLTSRSMASSTSTEEYGFVAVNGVDYMAYPWLVGNGLIGARVNQFDASYVYQAFDTPNHADESDSLLAFLNSTANGDYIILSVVQDGHTNVSGATMSAVAGLGSTMFSSLAAGDSWVFIGRKGYPAVATEQKNHDTANASLQMANYFSVGSGAMTSPPIAPPYSWHTLHWRYNAIPAGTSIRVALTRTRQTGTVDTMRILGSDSLDVNLAGDTSLTSTSAREYRLSALLSTANAEITPRFGSWWVDLEPPADLAMDLTVRNAGDAVVPLGAPLGIPFAFTNLGYRTVDSARLAVGVYNAQNLVQPLLTQRLGKVVVDTVVTGSVAVPTESLRGKTALELAVVPSDKSGDLIPVNDNASFRFSVAGAPQGGFDVFADGQKIRDGDFISARPRIQFEGGVLSNGYVLTGAELLVDGRLVQKNGAGGTVQSSTLQSDMFTPILTNGRHDLNARLFRRSVQGIVDTLNREIAANVLDDMHVLNLLNFPNPFANNTDIVFTLTRPAEALVVRIFTVAGRKIREITLPATDILNDVKVFWDGRDNDGDEVANGLYFYQVQATGGGKTDSAIGKMARAR